MSKSLGFILFYINLSLNLQSGFCIEECRYILMINFNNNSENLKMEKNIYIKADVRYIIGASKDVCLVHKYIHMY